MYSLGATVYALSPAAHPSAPASRDRGRAVERILRVAPADRPADVPASLERVLRAAMARDPTTGSNPPPRSAGPSRRSRSSSAWPRPRCASPRTPPRWRPDADPRTTTARGSGRFSESTPTAPADRRTRPARRIPDAAGRPGQPVPARPPLPVPDPRSRRSARVPARAADPAPTAPTDRRHRRRRRRRRPRTAPLPESLSEPWSFLLVVAVARASDLAAMPRRASRRPPRRRPDPSRVPSFPSPPEAVSVERQDQTAAVVDLAVDRRAGRRVPGGRHPGAVGAVDGRPRSPTAPLRSTADGGSA